MANLRICFGGYKEINKRRLTIRNEPSDNIIDTQNITRKDINVDVSVDLNINDQPINRSHNINNRYSKRSKRSN